MMMSNCKSLFLLPNSHKFDLIVISFVDRYIPGYVFFADGVADGVSAPCDLGKSDTLVISEGEGSPSPPSQPGYGWCGKSLRVLIDEDREVVRLEDF